MAFVRLSALALLLVVPYVVSVRRLTQNGPRPLKFQKKYWKIKEAGEAATRFVSCEKIAVVMEGDANRPDMRREAMLWVDFLVEQGYCMAYFIDYIDHASQAWKKKEVTASFGLTWLDAIHEVKQSDSGQVVQLMNSTLSNWLNFTGILETTCSAEPCKAKRVITIFEDHGEYRLLGLPNHTMMLREDFLGGLRSLYRLTKDVKMLSFVGACKSGSMLGGAQYTAKELLQTHYFDLELRSPNANAGPLNDQVATIAGHSFNGLRQRVLLRATEGLLEGQAMCDIAAGDHPEKATMEHVLGQFMEEGEESKYPFGSRTQAFLKDPGAFAKITQNPFQNTAVVESLIKAAMVLSSLEVRGTGGNSNIHTIMEQLKEYSKTFDHWKEIAIAIRYGQKAAGMRETMKTKKVQWEDYLTEIGVQKLKTKLNDIKDIDRDFSFEALVTAPDLREGSFFKAFNQRYMDSWFELRQQVDWWKTRPVGGAIWNELSANSTSAKVAENSPPVSWGMKCGTLSQCMGTFQRVQAVTLMDDEELGCMRTGLTKRMLGHLAAAGSDEKGIEQNSGIRGSLTGGMIKNLVRAVAYVEKDYLEKWDAQFLESGRTLPATGDFDYDRDPMLGAASQDTEPLDLVRDLDGDATRPESILAFSASVPQIISSSLLPFTASSITLIQNMLKAGRKNSSASLSFAAYTRAVEDFAINKDSIGHDMATFMIKVMLWAQGNPDQTLSVTTECAGECQADIEAKLAKKSTWWRKDKTHKAEFYKAIANGEEIDGFLNFTYVSPASGRTITRYFDYRMNSENFGSPVAFGNMQKTSISEFFSENFNNFFDRLQKIGEPANSQPDWLGQLAERNEDLGSEASKCCCKTQVTSSCELLVGKELEVRKSRNPFDRRTHFCPAHLGYKSYRSFGYWDPPASCGPPGAFVGNDEATAVGPEQLLVRSTKRQRNAAVSEETDPAPVKMRGVPRGLMKLAK